MSDPVVEEHDYEQIDDRDDGDMGRFRVPGGWLYRSREWFARDDSPALGVALAFVPDPPAKKV